MCDIRKVEVLFGFCSSLLSYILSRPLATWRRPPLSDAGRYAISGLVIKGIQMMSVEPLHGNSRHLGQCSSVVAIADRGRKRNRQTSTTDDPAARISKKLTYKKKKKKKKEAGRVLTVPRSPFRHSSLDFSHDCQSRGLSSLIRLAQIG